MADRAGLPFGDTADFEAADRGLVDAGDPVVRNEAGQVVWDNGSYRSFLTGDAPDTVHPSLWRQSTLVARQGLFEVTDGIYQVRGYDLSNLSVIEGEVGIIVIDPLISTQTAAAALALYRKHRGDRPVVAVIYTHSHIDHFGGVKGVVSQEEVDAGQVQRRRWYSLPLFLLSVLVKGDKIHRTGILTGQLDVDAGSLTLRACRMRKS